MSLSFPLFLEVIIKPVCDVAYSAFLSSLLEQQSIAVFGMSLKLYPKYKKIQEIFIQKRFKLKKCYFD